MTIITTKVIYNILDLWLLITPSVSSNFSGTRVAQWVRLLDYLTTHTSLSPIRRGFAPGFVNYKKGCSRLASASDKVYQFLAHGRWFSPGTPTSSTPKIGRHDIAEILLKVVLSTINQIKSNFSCWEVQDYVILVHYWNIDNVGSQV